MPTGTRVASDFGQTVFIGGDNFSEETRKIFCVLDECAAIFGKAKNFSRVCKLVAVDNNASPLTARFNGNFVLGSVTFGRAENFRGNNRGFRGGVIFDVTGFINRLSTDAV